MRVTVASRAIVAVTDLRETSPVAECIRTVVEAYALNDPNFGAALEQHIETVIITNLDVAAFVTKLIIGILTGLQLATSFATSPAITLSTSRC